LSEASIYGLWRSTRDGWKLFDEKEKPHLVPMTREFLSLGRQAHSHYVARFEEDRMNKEKKRKKPKKRQPGNKKRKEFESHQERRPKM